MSDEEQLDAITEGLVHWATMFYREELEKQAAHTGIPFTTIVHSDTKQIPLSKAKELLKAWHQQELERAVTEAMSEELAALGMFISDRVIALNNKKEGK